MDWQKSYAAIWRAKQGKLRAVKSLEDINFSDLIGIEQQKELLKTNTERFLAGLPANNVLLWGARGTGKSSLIKAMLNEYKEAGLRVIEVDRDNLDDLVDIADEVRDLPYSFIIFCDDLSFEDGEKGYRGLKSVLEGSIEAPPQNIKIYATSNRRHLVTEYHSDNVGARVGRDGELHYSDSVEEKISLSDRFGLWISFYHGNQSDYLNLVDFYFRGQNIEQEVLHKKALEFAAERASKSARTAKQFFNSFSKS